MLDLYEGKQNYQCKWPFGPLRYLALRYTNFGKYENPTTIGLAPCEDRILIFVKIDCPNIGISQRPKRPFALIILFTLIQVRDSCVISDVGM